MNNSYLLAVLLFLLSFSCNGKSDFNEYRNGDIIFQTSASSQSKAIQEATGSKYSHMGIVYINDGKKYVFEAVQPVKLTPLDDWIKRGVDGHYVVKRLKERDNILTSEKLAGMKKAGNRYRAKNYDIYFEWSDSRIYCSELVWKIYKEGAGVELSSPEKLGDFNLESKIVREKLKGRYGNDIPLNEKVVSPVAIFNSDKLETIYEN